MRVAVGAEGQVEDVRLTERDGDLCLVFRRGLMPPRALAAVTVALRPVIGYVEECPDRIQEFFFPGDVAAERDVVQEATV